MDIHEQIAVRMAQERMEDAVRATEQRRAVHSASVRQSTRVSLGRLGRELAKAFVRNVPDC